MCLIGLVPAREAREAVTDAWLRDIYKRNDDGFGFMWHTRNGGIKVYKAVGDADAFVRAYREVERHAKPFAFHVRMATHGRIEESQSHPYPVDDEGKCYMMHNGILDAGNHEDVAKSDTWHYIKNTIAPMFRDMGNKMFKGYMLDLIGEAIGNNRFVFVDGDGEFHVVNREQGLMWKGMWLSNRYAWPAALYGAAKPTPKYTSYTGYLGYKGTTNNVSPSTALTVVGEDEGYQDWLERRGGPTPVGLAEADPLDFADEDEGFPDGGYDADIWHAAYNFMATLRELLLYNVYDEVTVSEVAGLYAYDEELADDLLQTLEEDEYIGTLNASLTDEEIITIIRERRRLDEEPVDTPLADGDTIANWSETFH